MATYFCLIANSDTNAHAKLADSAARKRSPLSPAPLSFAPSCRGDTLTGTDAASAVAGHRTEAPPHTRPTAAGGLGTGGLLVEGVWQGLCPSGPVPGLSRTDRNLLRNRAQAGQSAAHSCSVFRCHRRLKCPWQKHFTATESDLRLLLSERGFGPVFGRSDSGVQPASGNIIQFRMVPCAPGWCWRRRGSPGSGRSA